MRRKIKAKKPLEPDLEYDSVKVAKFINYVMGEGKKNAARKIVYGMLHDLKEKGNAGDPVKLFEQAIENVSPIMEVRSRRIGGANYQVPREVRPERRMMLGMRWIIEAASAKSGKPMKERLFEEVLLASKKDGEAYKKRENTHKMADANRAFAHFSW